MWDVARRLGFKGGRVLEPSMGVGYFYGLMPRDLMSKSKLAGVELDPTTGAIARMLYPQASINVKGFQEVKIADGFYDMVIGNVPFGDFKVHDPDYNKYRANIHDYFILKSLDKTREGGIVAVITSTGTMDKADARIRQEIAKRADLVAAMRFPDSTFEKNAGTQVVTDLLIFRKRGADEKADTSWVDQGTMPDPDGGADIPISNYYVKNPDQILGRLDRKSKLYGGGQPHVSGTGDFAERFDKAIESLPEGVFGQRKAIETEPQVIGDAVRDNVVEGGYILRDGRIMQRQGDVYIAPDFTPEETAKAKMLIPVRDALNALNAAQLKGEETAAARRLLNRTYDAFVGKYGPVRKSTNAKLLAQDPSSYLLIALEKSYDSKARQAPKADIFTKDTITRMRQASDVSTPAAAVAVNLFETGQIDIDRIAQLLKTTPEKAGQQLIEKCLAFENPRGTWETAEDYLSGNVRKKLVEARTAAEVDEKYQPNVDALEKVQPADVPMDQISVKLGANWIPAEDIKKFAGSLMEVDPEGFNISYAEGPGMWFTGWGRTGASNSSRATEVYGTGRADFIKVLDAALNDNLIKIYDRTKDGSEFNAQASEQANAKVQEVKEQFADWLWADDERAKRLHRYYNDNFNSLRTIEYTGEHYADEDGKYRLPGMNPNMALRPNQIKDVWQAVSNGKLLDASEVGAGKTFILGAIAMEWKRLGISRKPAISVPKPRIAATVTELQLLYPAAKILSLEKSFDKENRKRTTAQMATGDYDMIVLSHEQLDKMPMSADIVNEFIGAELREIEERIIDAQDIDDQREQNRVVKRLEKIKERVEAKLQEALDATNKDDVVMFEETGIDSLLVDEAHAFKSLPVYSRRSDVKGVPTTRSDRATTMYMRTRWLMRQNNNKGVVFATGTPVTNTLAEVFNMQRYLQPELLEERGIENFDAWANQFADVTTESEHTASGEFKEVSRMADFVNLPELQQMIRQIMATNFVDDMTWINRPKKIENIITAKMTDEQVDYLQDIRRRVLRLRSLSPQQRKAEKDNYLLISTDARKSALSPRMVNARAKDSGGKIEKVAEKVLEIHRERPDVAQMIFLDLGVNPNDWGYSVYDDIQNRLILGGIPKEKIANFGRMSDGARQKAAAKLNSGEYLIGIGSSGKMGTGINAQERLAAMHHVDAPWLPAFLEQRNGRGHRQGNMNDPTKPAEDQKVEAYYYTTEGSFDKVMWQAITRKSNFIRDFMRGDLSVREMRMDDTGDEDTGEMGPEMILAATSGNPYELDRIKLIKDIERLDRLARSHRQQQSRYKTRIAEAGRNRAELEAKIGGYEPDIAQYEATKGQKFATTINGKSYEDRKVADNQLAFAVKEAPEGVVTKIGEYRGFDIKVTKTKKSLDAFLQRAAGPKYYFFVSLAEPEGAFKSADSNLREPIREKERALQNIEDLERDVDTAKAEVDKPFKREQELTEKQERLRVIERKMEEMFDQGPGADARKIANRMSQISEDAQYGRLVGLGGIREKTADILPDKDSFDRYMMALKKHGILEMQKDDQNDPMKGSVFDPETKTYYWAARLLDDWKKKADTAPKIADFQLKDAGRRAARSQMTRLDEGEFRSKPQWVTDAEQRLREASTGRRAGSGGQQLADLAIVTGWKAYEAGMGFAEWAREVIAKAGEKVKPYLRETWKKLQTPGSKERVRELEQELQSTRVAFERSREEWDQATDNLYDLETKWDEQGEAFTPEEWQARQVELEKVTRRLDAISTQKQALEEEMDDEEVEPERQSDIEDELSSLEDEAGELQDRQTEVKEELEARGDAMTKAEYTAERKRLKDIIKAFEKSEAKTEKKIEDLDEQLTQERWRASTPAERKQILFDRFRENGNWRMDEEGNWYFKDTLIHKGYQIEENIRDPFLDDYDPDKTPAFVGEAKRRLKEAPKPAPAQSSLVQSSLFDEPESPREREIAEDLPESKSFGDPETRSTADLSLLESGDEFAPGIESGPVYFFNRLKVGDPGKGIGTKLLKQVTAFADKTGVPILNHVSAYGNLSQEQPVDYYLRNGFERVDLPEFKGEDLLIYRPESVNRERSRGWQPKPLSHSVSLADIAVNTRFRTSKGRGRANVIYGNQQAQYWMERADKRLYNDPQRFNGLNLSARDARRYAAELRKEKKRWQQTGIRGIFHRAEAKLARQADAQIEAMAKTLEDLADKHERVIYVRAGRPFQKIRQTVYHELTHNVERQFKDHLRNWFRRAPHSDQIREDLDRLGYKESDYTSEAVAHILAGQFDASGQRGKLTLSLDEATEFLDEYLNTVAFRRGREALNAFDPMRVSPQLRPALRQAKERYGPRTIQEGTGGPPSALPGESGGDGRDRSLRPAERSASGSGEGRQGRAERLSEEPYGRRATPERDSEARVKIPLPTDWDLGKWSSKVINELGKQYKEGKLTERQADRLTDIIEDVLQAHKEGDGAKLFLARERLAQESAAKFSAADFAGGFRTIKAGLDISYMLRQGGAYNYPGLIINPKETILRIGRGFKAFREEDYARLNAQIAASPRAIEMRKSDLFLTNQRKVEHGNRLSDREEGYLGRFMQKIPGWKQSERGNTTLLDMIRVDVFDRYAKYLEKRGVTFENNPRAFKQVADFVNLMTGRGSLGESFDQAVPFLSLLLFSPRWLASRVQLLGKAGKLTKDEIADLLLPSGKDKGNRINPEVRKLMWRDLGAYAGAMGLTLGVLAAAGAAGLANIDLGDDPDDSDFGKVVINGKHGYDLTGGLQQYLVLGTRLAKSAIKQAKGEKWEEREKPFEIIMKFLRGKASPAAGLATDIATGEDFRGRPVTAVGLAKEAFVPLIATEFMDGWNVEGKAIGAAGLIPSALGINYSAYERAGEAAGAPDFAKEARRRGVYFGEKFLRGESADMAKSRTERRKSYVSQYGPALVGSRGYQGADDATKTKMLELFADRTNDLANEKQPQFGDLRPGAILQAIRTSAKATETRKKNERQRQYYAAP